MEEPNAPKADAGALLWLLGAADKPQRRTRKSPGVHTAWTARHVVPDPVPAHLASHHGGYVSPTATHRGGPPSREQCSERVRKSIARAKSKVRQPVIAWAQKQLNEEEEWIRSKLREEMEEDPFDENLTGGKCSLLGRSRGVRCTDHGADRYEALADKGLLLQLGGRETHRHLEQRKKELREKQMMMRINEARKAAVKDVESVAARRRAADILSELHKRTIFAELAQKRESQEREVKISVQVASQAAAIARQASPASNASSRGEDDVSEAPLKASSKSSGRVTIIAPPPEKTKPEVIRVTVHSAKGIRPADVNGLADPFCVVEVPGKPGMRVHTQVMRRTLNPEWDETFMLRNFTESDDVSFQVYDYDFDKNECLGTALVKGSRIVENGLFEEELQLEDTNNMRFLGRHNHASKGLLTVSVAILNTDGVTVRRADSFTRQLRMSFAGRMQAVREAIQEREEIAQPRS